MARDDDFTWREFNKAAASADAVVAVPPAIASAQTLPKIRTVLAALVAAASSLCAQPALARGHVRFVNDRIAEVFEYAMNRSPSFRELIATLDILDRVVYVEEGQCGDGTPRGCLVLMPMSGGKKLLVRINPRQPNRLVAAQLAHELYHAMEVAQEPDVVDELSLRELYRRIGHRSCFNEGDGCWETRAATAFEALVVRELRQ